MSKRAKDPYAELHSVSKDIATFGSMQTFLEWDQETYMPKGGIVFRSQQVEAMASLVHKMKTGSKFSKALDQLIDIKTGEIADSTLPPEKIAALRDWRREYLKTIKLPNSFVKTFSKTTSEAMHAWKDAKKEGRFKSFAPHLEKIVKLSRKKADLLGFAEHPYDALLDLYEPGMTTSYLTPLFARLKIALTSLLKDINSRDPISTDCLRGHFPHHKQIHIAHLLLKAMGMDTHVSRLDESAHPFCLGLHPKDVRMTTRIHTDSFTPSFFAVMHEAGHGLYELGLPEEQFGSPLCEYISLGIHESQSRWWETRIGHSRPFWDHFYPFVQKEFPETLGSVHLNDFYRAINIVKPTLIRIYSDEVTYSLHIIVRFEMEKALIEGNLKVKDVPEAWNAKMREYLGIVPMGDAEGCLQDIHWSMGGMGYFPTYTLGNLYASQFFSAFEKTHPTWREKLAQGDMGFIRQWLHENIHRYGRRYTAEELCVRITGKPVDEKAFIDYLHHKYKGIYHIT